MPLQRAGKKVPGLWVCLLALLLSACATGPSEMMTPSHWQQAKPANDAILGTPAEALLQRAIRAKHAGNLRLAGHYLERAIGFANGSSWLYFQMATLRLAEGKPAIAEGFTHHAIRNANQDDGLYRARLFFLLSTCYQQQGNKAQAAAAQQRAQAMLADS